MAITVDLSEHCEMIATEDDVTFRRYDPETRSFTYFTLNRNEVLNARGVMGLL